MSSEPESSWSEYSSSESESTRVRFDPLSHWWVWAAAIFVLLSTVYMRFGDPRSTIVFSNVVLAGSAVAATAALGILTSRCEALDAFGWGSVTVGMGFFAAGELSWLSYELWLGGVPYPGVPDIFYLGGYLFVVVGLLVITVAQHRLGGTLRIVLDGLLVAVALLTISWHVVLEPILAVTDVDPVTLWVSLAYPMLDIVVGSIAFLVAASARGRRRIAITLVASGIFAWVFADSAFAYMSFNGGYVYNEIDAVWLAGYLVIALAALHPATAQPPVASDRRRYEFWETIAPYVPFLIAMGVTGYTARVGALGRVGLGLGAVVLLSLVARQTYVFHDASVLSRQLERNEAMLARQNEELVLLNRIIRHDLRNDLTVVLGWGEVLSDRVDADGRTILETILDTARDGIALTDTLQALTDAWDATDDHELEPISLEKTLTGAIERRRETYANAAFVVDGTVPDVDVLADHLLSTVFRNVLNNAVQHNDAETPRVEVSVELEDETVAVRISDNGPGIPPDRRDTVFGRGERGLGSTGSGIGLYLVDTLVTRYGGDVWIEANDDDGAVFVIELRRYDD
ncbi:sensor histidine kinase [Halosolutus gelatinilyticus]|uniref:sensor histidine kinase n=1 Tax=Halosolutus gelatinilyticus TaxID=2931975 RepID=UPI001FF3EECE|nr:HAMP domain-containing sensor histidine kinase [Halosolutus gelatinilyticus]